MQLLNVGAGRTEAEFQHEAELQRDELRADSLSAANTFFYAAALAVLGTGLFFIRINIFVSIGLFDLLTFYGRALGPLYPLALFLAAVAWVAGLVALGFLARHGLRWAFLVGLAIYAVDMCALIIMISFWAFGVHSFFVYRWYQGQKAVKEMHDLEAIPAPPSQPSASAATP